MLSHFHSAFLLLAGVQDLFRKIKPLVHSLMPEPFGVLVSFLLRASAQHSPSGDIEFHNHSASTSLERTLLPQVLNHVLYSSSHEFLTDVMHKKSPFLLGSNSAKPSLKRPVRLGLVHYTASASIVEKLLLSISHRKEPFSSDDRRAPQGEELGLSEALSVSAAPWKFPSQLGKSSLVASCCIIFVIGAVILLRIRDVLLLNTLEPFVMTMIAQSSPVICC
ncbi:hypothetical protein Tco_0567176 [Tanacetum coccineum]